ncbi:helix-turn-helix domain-containing protein [Microbacterium sp. M1A1_1b]|uniref:Transposase n=1 Tax=Curtobacterium salicis TaxID=1779862 RepID=A0ABX0T2Y7_9MICO|nr:helix-turn-helix domain-containing protein [Curtobacterium sp. WW7]NII39479.1 putative transposase [Curtobacterium sp. WW7]
MDASERWRILRLHVEDAIPLTTLARTTGVAERTLQRWLAGNRTGGYTALADGTRTDHGARRTAPELVRLIGGLALTKPRPSIATIRRQIGIHCSGRGLPSRSYSVMRSIVTTLDPGMVTLALEGPASYGELGKTLDPDDFSDAQTIAAVERITRGNFRLLEHLLLQIQRVLRINELDVTTNDVVEAARSTLVIGTTRPDADRSENDDTERGCSQGRDGPDQQQLSVPIDGVIERTARCVCEGRSAAAEPLP